MLTLQMTAGNNNETIWMLRINTSTPIYLSTRDIALTNSWDGRVLNFNNYLSDLTQNSSIQDGGGTGEVSSMSFSISRYVGNTNFDDFFNDWYPATGKGYLSGVTVDFGVCWVGATTDTEITWRFRGRIVDYSYEQRKLNITVFQESEISNKEIPYYSVQKDFNNGISYFENASDEKYGETVPVIYGDFTLTGTEGISQNIVSALSPCINVDQTKYMALVASHKCNTNADLYQFIDQLEVKQSIDSFDLSGAPTQTSSSQTSNSGTTFTLLDANNGTITGGLVLYPKLKGTYSNFGDFKFNKWTGLKPYKLDAGDIISFRFDSYENAPMLGEFNNVTDIKLKIDFTNTVSPPGAAKNIQILTYDHQLQTNIDVLDDIVTGSQTKIIDYPAYFVIEDWDWKKILNLEFKITNLYDTPTEYIWINKIYLYAYYYYAKGYYGIGQKIYISYPKLNLKYIR